MRQIYIDITGGSLTILNEWKIGQDDGPGVIVNMSGGVVNVGTFMDLCGWSENYSMGTLNMSGGTVNIEQDLRMGMWTTSHSYLNLEGGTIEAYDLEIGVGEAEIDITEGMLILSGNRTADIEWYAENGLITGYGGAGTVLFEYLSSTNRTRVTAIPEPITILLLGLGVVILRRKV